MSVSSVGAGVFIAETEKNPHVQNVAIQQLQQGRSNAVVLASLTASVASTTVTFANCGAGCAILACPMTSNAAAALSTMYVASVSNGSFNIVHANNGQTDRTFRFACIG